LKTSEFGPLSRISNSIVVDHSVPAHGPLE
jgi:hypothetical protein